MKQIFFSLLILAASLRSYAQENRDDQESTLVDTSAVSDSEQVEHRGGRQESDSIDTFVLRTVPDSVSTRFQREKEFGYANDAEYWTEKKHGESNRLLEILSGIFQSKGMRVIAYILITALLIFAIYRVVFVNNFYMFYSSRKRKITGEPDAHDILDENLDEKIKTAVRNQDLRLATRYLYLRTLKALNEKKLIRFHAQATNKEYVQQLQHFSGAKEFGFLTRVYEYVWYGEFPVTKEQFEMISQHFFDLNQSVKLA